MALALLVVFVAASEGTLGASAVGEVAELLPKTVRTSRCWPY